MEIKFKPKIKLNHNTYVPIGLVLINCVKYAKGIAPITADVNSLSL